MLEFFRAILDAVLAITPKALTARKDAKLNSLGAELFVLYLRAHRIADNGDYLLGFLENTATMSEEEVRAQTSWVRRLHAAARQQAADLRGLNSEMTRLGGCLAALDPQAYGRLKNGMWEKFSRIDHLRMVLAGPALPDPRALGLFPGPDPVTDPVGRLAGLLSRPEGAMESPGALESPAALDLRDPLTPRARAEIARYLAEHRPREQLEEIRAQLKILHEALERTFTLSDILVSLSAAGKADPGGFLRD
ncbi:hypothetical protein [Amycolatopsis thermoflava]|uniref:hypothetical protein n=1 Tax=Amycolatopsis thermoflava TaxID=84480 RepID=UPI0037FC28D3